MIVFNKTNFYISAITRRSIKDYHGIHYAYGKQQIILPGGLAIVRERDSNDYPKTMIVCHEGPDHEAENELLFHFSSDKELFIGNGDIELIVCHHEDQMDKKRLPTKKIAITNKRDFTIIAKCWSIGKGLAEEDLAIKPGQIEELNIPYENCLLPKSIICHEESSDGNEIFHIARGHSVILGDNNLNGITIRHFEDEFRIL